MGKNINERFGFLVVEKSDSVLGCKLILDYASIKNKILIRRVNETNQALLSSLELDKSPKLFPLVYLINKMKSTAIAYEKFDENLIKKHAKANDILDFDMSLPDGVNNDRKMSLLIGKFIKLNSLINKETLDDTEESNNPAQVEPNPTQVEPNPTNKKQANTLIQV